MHVPDQKFLQEMLKESMFFENYPEVSYIAILK